MTDSGPPEGIDYQDHLTRALESLVPDLATEGPDVPTDVLAQAGRVAVDRHNRRHRSLHAVVQHGGAVVWALRERGFTWREIYDATGIVQRTGDRWRQLFLAEGVTPRPAAELDNRWQRGNNPEGGAS